MKFKVIINSQRVILLSFLVFYSWSSSLFAQTTKVNQMVFDDKSKTEIMIGYCTLEGMRDTGFLASYQKEYDHYNPDKSVMNQMYSLLNGITVTIVMGTWCSDSRVQVPRFMRLFDDLEHSFATPTFICVDENKKAGDVDIQGLDIQKVPTFIVYYKGKELGRIIETPTTSLDQDFLNILKK